MKKRFINPLKPLFDRLPSWLRNRYYFVLVSFAVLMIFFDKHDVLTQFKLYRTIQRLKGDKVYYLKMIEKAREDAKDLEANKEKFAREHYFMSKTGEDVFIIQEEK